ncbi:Retrovirus-related Pol polyprotein from transposon 17.6 [Frankliniella fusca]|uniref:Retrovirus-related Pol polyprotein from transposon 17.6 n=1 Tax=Frankliniella fusca TaxID=407009 RepID=A0AAE1HSF5_9NEOP|nr:Retrovirus-related Pol polyprotein from transposon 17.6 [Frankliniella fusca]
MEAGGIIAKVEHLTEESWVSNIVIVTKPNKSIRICLDPVDLNKAFIREPHLIPTVAEISERLSHQEYYTLLDLKDGFYHIQLDEPSSFKCCFATPFGLYRFLGCPFGVVSAPELFQRLNEEIFKGIYNVLIYFDDVLAFGKTKDEHDQAVRQVIQRAREVNVKFNPEKLQYKQNSVKYVGHLFSSKGMAVDRDRLNIILQLQPPKSPKELQSNTCLK